MRGLRLHNRHVPQGGWQRLGPSADIWRALGLMILAGAAGSCAKEQKVEWAPSPRIDIAHLTTELLPPIALGYDLLVDQPTRGLFPASIAVCRVSLVPDEGHPGGLRPRIHADPRNEFLQWNRAFDNLMAISEVFPIAERTLGGGEATPEQILAAYRAVHGRLGLIYAINELSETETEMIGVLYETQSRRPIAQFRSAARSRLPPDAKEEEPVNLWQTDSRALVRADFERLIHRALRELILGDKPVELEDSSGWKPIEPVRSANWPPGEEQSMP